jgi:hypothetical protein
MRDAIWFYVQETLWGIKTVQLLVVASSYYPYTELTVASSWPRSSTVRFGVLSVSAGWPPHTVLVLFALYSPRPDASESNLWCLHSRTSSSDASLPSTDTLNQPSWVVSDRIPLDLLFFVVVLIVVDPRSCLQSGRAPVACVSFLCLTA